MEEWMTDFSAISKDLVQSLRLQYEPVGINLYGDEEVARLDLSFSEGSFKSYCHALTAAGKGQTLVLRKEQMGCKLGTSVLGLETDTEAFLDDGVLEKYGVGLFATEEASAATILDSTFLEKGSTKAVRIGPLSACTEQPQVIVFTADSEQVMWLLYAVNYKRGGKMNLPQSGGALGGCADITALPLKNGEPNVTFLGLGCRLKSATGPSYLMMGMPAGLLNATHKHVMAMAKPIAMLKNAQQPG
jgi:uncharacterized protein (DUF169 family)